MHQEHGDQEPGRRPTGDVGLGQAPSGGESRPADALNGSLCLVLMYHYVHDRPGALDGSWPEQPDGVRGLAGADFAAQLDRLCEMLEPLDWPTLYAWTVGRARIPERSFLLTFDDGLHDHIENVVPILSRRGLRGVFFVPGAILATHRMLAAHAVHLLLSRLGDEAFLEALRRYLADQGAGRQWVSELDASLSAIDDDRAQHDATTMYHYESPLRGHLKFFLTMVLPIELRNGAVATLFERHVGSSPRWARHWYLSWDDLVRMQALGHTIGAHGYAHEPYARLEPQERNRDLIRVANVLREGLGHDLRPFSFPYGSATDDLAQTARQTGFAHAFGTERRVMTQQDSPFHLPRVDTIHAGLLLEELRTCHQH